MLIDRSVCFMGSFSGATEQPTDQTKRSDWLRKPVSELHQISSGSRIPAIPCIAPEWYCSSQCGGYFSWSSATCVSSFILLDVSVQTRYSKNLKFNFRFNKKLKLFDYLYNNVHLTLLQTCRRRERRPWKHDNGMSSYRTNQRFLRKRAKNSGWCAKHWVKDSQCPWIG